MEEMKYTFSCLEGGGCGDGGGGSGVCGFVNDLVTFLLSVEADLIPLLSLDHYSSFSNE